jgi:hypothetical protein
VRPQEFSDRLQCHCAVSVETSAVELETTWDSETA